MFNGAPLPAKVVSMNAYLGARPIAAALDAGAQVVITGRCVDSALALGPLLHEFGWADTDYDRLSARQSRGSPDRVWRAGRRRTVHRLGSGAGLGRHGLSDRRMPRGWIAHDHQAGRHGWSRHAGIGLRADALRDWRPGCLSVARRHLRLDRRELRTGRRRSGRDDGCQRPRAVDKLQGLRDVR